VANVCTDIDQHRRSSITDELVAYCYDVNGGTGPSVCAICNDPRIARGDFLMICSAHRLHGEKVSKCLNSVHLSCVDALFGYHLTKVRFNFDFIFDVFKQPPAGACFCSESCRNYGLKSTVRFRLIFFIFSS